MFGKYCIDADRYSIDFWNKIYDILYKEFPVPGVLIHENSYLSNCMTRMLSGDKYLQFNKETSLDQAVNNIKQKDIKIALYKNFNDSLQKILNEFNIPINMSNNKRAKLGEPDINKHKKQLGKYYGAPDNIIEWLINNNQNDIQLYNLILKENKYG